MDQDKRKKELIQFVVTSLEKELGKGNRYSEVQTAKMCEELLKQPDKAIEAAYDWFILNTDRLPTPQKFLDSVEIERKKIADREAEQRENEWKKLKGEDQYGRVDGKTILSREQHTEYSRRAHRMLLVAVSKGPCQELVDICAALGNDYPHVREESRQLRQDIIEMMEERRIA